MKTFTGAALLLGVLLSSIGCNEGGGSNTASAAVSAKNIVFRNPSKPSTASGDQVLKEGSVYAENVILETAANALSSTNLQDALDNELAINLATLLPGTTWKVTNVNKSEFWQTPCQITFSLDGTGFNVDFGNFAPAQFTQEYISLVTCDLLDNNALFTTVQDPRGGIKETTITVITRNRKQITFYSAYGAAILTKVE